MGSERGSSSEDTRGELEVGKMAESRMTPLPPAPRHQPPISDFRDAWLLSTESEKGVREPVCRKTKGLSFGPQAVELFLGHSGGGVEQVDVCPGRWFWRGSISEMAAHCPRASAFPQGAAKRGPRQHLREHQSVMDEQSMGGREGHRRARELP